MPGKNSAKKTSKKKSIKKNTSVKKKTSKKTSVKKKTVNKVIKKKSNTNKNVEENKDNDQDQDEDDISNYTIDDKVNSSIIETDCLIDTTKDVKSNKIETVSSENRISRPLLTRYEMVRIIGERTIQLKKGAKPLIKNYNNFSYEEIAVKELINNMTPYKIKRKVNNKYEIWELEELRKDHLKAILN